MPLLLLELLHFLQFQFQEIELHTDKQYKVRLKKLYFKTDLTLNNSKFIYLLLAFLSQLFFPLGLKLI